MKLRWLLVVLALGLPWRVEAAKVTIDDLMRLRSISEVCISPDGERVAYVVSTPSFERDEHEAVLYVLPRQGGIPLRLTYATRIFNQPLPAPALRWSPDGSLISFAGFVDGVPQIMAMSSAGGEPWPLTSFQEGVTEYEWSPDGKKIAFLSPDPPPASEVQRKKDKSYVIEVDRNERFPRIWIQDVSGKAPRALTPPNQFIMDFGWSPDGRMLVYSASDVSGFNAMYRTRIYQIAAAGGDPQAVVDRPGMNLASRYSPDGRWIAFISTDGYNGQVAAEGLYLVSSDGDAQTIRNLTKAIEPWIGEFVWAPDSRSILFIPNEQTGGSAEHMFEEPIMRVWLDDGRIESLTPQPVVHFSLSLSRDGRYLAYKSVQNRTMGDVFVMSLSDRRATQLTEINPELHTMELGELKPVHWKSSDNAEIWGLLLTPPGYKTGTRIPLVVYCHGGPVGGFTYGIFPQFMHRPGQVDPYPTEAMASAGIAVLFAMPRGGSGYGIAGYRAIVNAWGEVDYRDIMAGVDYVVAQGIADPNRLGVMGISYGGFMTSWIVTHTSRFKAASTGASVNDLTQEYYLSDAGDFIQEYFGVPWEAAATLVAHSPITYVQQVTTPLLIQHGEKDVRVPPSQAWEFYKALKVLHKTVEFDIYPRGGHLNFEPALEREYMRRNLEWFIRWLKPQIRQ